MKNKSEHRSQQRVSKQRRQHRWPTCEATGKTRFGELKDARQALKHATHARWAAGLDGATSTRREVRAYRCPDCRGYHLTSKQLVDWLAASIPQPRAPRRLGPPERHTKNLIRQDRSHANLNSQAPASAQADH